MSDSEATFRPDGTFAASLCSLEEFQRALQGSVMYGLDHPAVQQAMKSCVLACSQADGIRVHGRGTRFFVAETSISDVSTFATLCQRLTSLRIASLALAAQVTVEDIEAMIVAWRAVTADARWENAAAEELSRATGNRIECSPTHYGHLCVTEDTNLSNSEIEIDWSGIGNDLRRVARGSGGLTATELASRINNNLDAQLGGIPTNVLESAADALSEAAPQDRAAAEARLALFFNSLSCEIRECTARLDSACPMRSFKVLEELAGPLSVGAVVSNIEDGDVSNLATPDGVRLLAKLVWLSRDQEKISGRIGSVLEQVRTCLTAVMTPPDGVLEAVDILRDAAKLRNFEQKNYERLIKSLAPAENVRVKSPPAGWTTQSAQLHAFSIAIELSLDPNAPPDNLESALSFVQEHLGSLADCSTLELLGDLSRALAAARDRCLTPAVIDAIARCEDALCAPQMAARIIAAAHKGGDTFDVIGLFARCSGRCVAALVRSIMAGHVPLNPTPLLNHPSLNMRDFAIGLFRGDPAILSKVAGLGGVTLERRARLAHAMLAHDSADYRLVAYRTFSDLYAQWPSSLVAHALSEDDSRICQIGIDRLDDNPENLQLLGTLLVGGLGFEPDAALVESGLRALERQGAEAVLRDVAGAMFKRPTPARVARGARALFAAKRSARKCA